MWGNNANVTTTHLDFGTDSPAAARSELYLALLELQKVIDGRGVASGVASLDASALVPLAQLLRAPAVPRQVAFVAAGADTWDVPANVTRIRVFAVGAGGGGGFRAGSNHGGGGGAGGVAIGTFTVAPGDTVSYTVGLGGAGAPNGPDADGSDGADTSVTVGAVTIFGRGGIGGKGAASSFGGAGGGATNGDVQIPGGSAASGESRGGMGGANAFTGSTISGSSSAWGGGGFGSGGSGSDAANGGHGAVMIEY